jgi:tRNA(Ile)-lysidine synthase
LTNQDTRYFRNHLRHELIPELEDVNPRFKDVARRMADVLGEEDQFLTRLADQAWDACFREVDEGSVVLSRLEFLELEKALQRRVLRRAVGLLSPDLRDIGFEAIERGLAFALEPTESGRMDMAARLDLVVLDERLVVKTWSAALPEDDLPLLPETGFVGLLGEGDSLTLAHGWVLTLDCLEMAPGLAETEAQQLGPKEVWLDAGTLHLPLTVRAKGEGERWQPLGMKGHSQKLSDFFVNEKIPQHLRDRWPLVCDEDDVAWVTGLRPAEPFKVGPATTRLVRLRLRQTPSRD